MFFFNLYNQNFSNIALLIRATNDKKNTFNFLFSLFENKNSWCFRYDEYFCFWIQFFIETRNVCVFRIKKIMIVVRKIIINVRLYLINSNFVYNRIWKFLKTSLSFVTKMIFAFRNACSFVFAKWFNNIKSKSNVNFFLNRN